MSLPNFSWCSQQSNSRRSRPPVPEQMTSSAMLSSVVMTQCYGHLQKQMNPHPKFGLAIETDNVIYTPEGYEKAHNLHYWGLWGKQGRPLKQVQNDWREQGKVAGLVFIVVWGRASGRVPGCRQRLVWFKSPVGAREGGTQAFLSACIGVLHKGKLEGWDPKAVSSHTSKKEVRLLIKFTIK